jgi:hypothetical protein
MKRDYNTGKLDNVEFFIGKEIEKTPAFNMKTLFVVGVHSPTVIENILLPHQGVLSSGNNIRHIFFGANHSYNPADYDEHKQWDEMIGYFLDRGYLCSLDIPLGQVEEFNDSGLNESSNFIPQIRVPIPYIRLWNYNTMIKIDDVDFQASNPGIWTHSLHELMDRGCFTSWDQYSNDKVIK